MEAVNLTFNLLVPQVVNGSSEQRRPPSYNVSNYNLLPAEDAIIANASPSWPLYDLMYNGSATLPFVLNGGGEWANATSSREDHFEFWQIVLLSSFAGITSVLTILGNIVVVLSFFIERSIRQPTNYFIASLACSDLLIGIISMPFYTTYLLMEKRWILGEFLCDIWLSIDYTVCLTSIYTVFCITVDRYCMVRIPARYRTWRTQRKVLFMIALTWLVPVLVFFTSIIGWQYFVGERTVPEGQCHVQYMDDAVFNCVLQVAYFWITLIVMIALYTGIYKVALLLQRKKEYRQRKMTSLVSMAGQTMTKIGIGMSQQQTANALITSMQKPAEETTEQRNTLTIGAASLHAQPSSSTTATSTTTSFNSGPKGANREEDRSSSPAFPSDTDASSQSPRLSHHDGGSSRKRSKRAGGKSTDKRSSKAENNNKRAKADNTKVTKHVNGDAFEKSALLKSCEDKVDVTIIEKVNDVKSDDQDSIKSMHSNHGSDTTSPVWKRRASHSSNSNGETVPRSTEVMPNDRSRRNTPLCVEVNANAGRVVTRIAAKAQHDAPVSPTDSCDEPHPAVNEATTQPGVLRTFFAAAMLRQATRRERSKKNVASKSENRARKALRTITIILGAFVFCWTPWHVLSLVMGFCPQGMTCMHTVLYDISYWLCYLNSPINPLCYALVNQQFKKTFVRIMKFDWHRT